MRIGSLFSGYGGLDLAVEAATGAQPAWFCEWDKAPTKVLNHHWPHVPNHRDVTQINWHDVEPVDIITGGSPCQDLSQAGKRAGMTQGTRSNLWVSMREAVNQLRPQLVVWENVLGALSAQAESESDNATFSGLEPGGGLLAAPRNGHLRALGRVLGDFTEIGYDAEWATLRASDIGAPHHRARVFLIAWPHVPNSSSIRSQTQQLTSRSAEENTGDNNRERIFPNTAHDGRERTGQTRGGRPGSTDCRNRTIEWGRYAPAVRRWEQLIGPAPAPTEPNSKGNPRLNAAFAEWMMGLPPGWVTDPAIGLTRSQQLKAIGNGVCPQQATAALTQLLERRAHGHTPTDTGC